MSGRDSTANSTGSKVTGAPIATQTGAIVAKKDLRGERVGASVAAAAAVQTAGFGKFGLFTIGSDWLGEA
jgi:hypothetical protein